jgi:hypothetical protein
MAVVIDIRLMRADLTAFGKAAKSFLRNHQRLAELERQLVNAAADARTREGRKLRWSTTIGTGGSILTEVSNSHRGPKDRAKKMMAQISFDFSGFLDEEDDNRLIIRTGATEVKLSWDDGEGMTLYHFDIHPDAAGHPVLHVQFDGPIAGIPRLHSIFAHPLDILEFTLMELFQTTWRQSRVEAKFVSELKKFPTNQRKRLLALFTRYQDWVRSSDRALISLQNSPATPLELYPA